MSTSVNSVTNHFPSAENGFSTTTSASVSSGATTVELNSLAGYEDGEVVVFIIDPDDAVKKQTFTGVVDFTNTRITSVVWTAGTNQSHILGATVVDYATATHISMISKGLMVQHKQSGAHANTITTNTINENTAANGVTIDGLNIKDSKLNTNDSVVTANITDAAVTSAKISGIDKSLTTTDSNPYKFSAYRSTAFTWGNNTFAKITCNTEQFDTNNNYDTSTGRYTAPVTGFYYVHGQVRGDHKSGSGMSVEIRKNGSEVFSGDTMVPVGYTGTFGFQLSANGIIALTAGDYIELFCYGAANTGQTGLGTIFQGFLISRT